MNPNNDTTAFAEDFRLQILGVVADELCETKLAQLCGLMKLIRGCEFDGMLDLPFYDSVYLRMTPAFVADVGTWDNIKPKPLNFARIQAILHLTWEFLCPTSQELASYFLNHFQVISQAVPKLWYGPNTAPPALC